MGGALVRLFDGRELLYLSDAGPDRLLEVGTTESPVDEAIELGAADEGERSLFSWAAFTEDLDQNGLDDLSVLQGDTTTGRGAEPETNRHADRILMQTITGFEMVKRGVFAPDSEVDVSARSGGAADLDYDGLFEIIATPILGAVRVEREVEPEWGGGRTTLVPETRYVHQLGAGFALWSEHGWRARGGHGSPRWGGSPYITAPQGTGLLRFPSGAVVPFEADDPGPIRVEEPEWLQIDRTDGEVRVAIDEVYWPEEVEDVYVAHRSDSGTVLVSLTREDDVWTGPADGGEIMLRIGRRWIGRWW
jgi:hypothetical protein